MAKGGSTTRTQGALTLLIVDDERSLRFSIGEWARDMGYTPLEAAGGREALEAVREHGADAVLLDLRLGDEDGLKLLRQIREVDPDVPVVMLTALHDIHVATNAFRRGAVAARRPWLLRASGFGTGSNSRLTGLAQACSTARTSCRIVTSCVLAAMANLAWETRFR